MNNFHGVSSENPCQYSLKFMIGKVRQRPSQCLLLWQQPGPENHDIISETRHLARIIHQPEKSAGEGSIVMKMSLKKLYPRIISIQKHAHQAVLAPSKPVSWSRWGAPLPRCPLGPTATVSNVSRLVPRLSSQRLFGQTHAGQHG